MPSFLIQLPEVLNFQSVNVYYENFYMLLIFHKVSKNYERPKI